MIGKRLPILVLVLALAGLGGSVAWAVNESSDSHWRPALAGPGMMGYGYQAGNAAPVKTITEAKSRAQTFADRLGLKADEVLQFERNFYVKLVDSKGNGATEVLVDPQTGYVSIEYGPAMMWNTEYGMMSGRYGAGMMGSSAVYGMMGRYGAAYGGMMGGSNGGMMGGAGFGGVTSGGYGGMMGGGNGGMMGGGAYAPPAASPSTPTGKPVSLAEAHSLAQSWLDTNEQGTVVEQGGDAFPGYYTLETLRDGKISGMISVNASTGVVWAHWWHGTFIAKSA